MKVPYMAVIGEREAESGTVAVRKRGGGPKAGREGSIGFPGAASKRDRVAHAGVAPRTDR